MHPVAQQVVAPLHAGPPLHRHSLLFSSQRLPFVQPQPSTVQTPARQLSPAPHALSHAPQCAGSLEVSKQPPGVPFDCGGQQRWLPTQALPPSHEHSPLAHSSPMRQLLPHAPQLRTSSLSTVHIPPRQVSSLLHDGPPGPNPPGPPGSLCVGAQTQVPCWQTSPA